MINGLEYKENVIDEKKEDALVRNIYSKPWSTALKRRVQHYGFEYDYKTRSVKYPNTALKIPKFIHDLANELKIENFDQVIINEYKPGEGITHHIDNVKCFDKKIYSLSLLSPTMMEFKKGNDKKQLYLQPRSLICMTDDARYNWTHCIPNKKEDLIDGKIVVRTTRVSITFRKCLK